MIWVANFWFENDFLGLLDQYQVTESLWGSAGIESGPFWPAEWSKFIFINNDREILPNGFHSIKMTNGVEGTCPI